MFINSPTALVPNARQQGVALITALIFLVILSIMGVTAARMASLEERMAGNMRDRDVAFRAAEMGLRDAERNLIALVDAGTMDSCLNVPTGTVSFGTNTGATDIPGLFAQPTYTVSCSMSTGVFYTVRVTANGAKPGTTVVIEEVLRFTEA